MDSPAIAFLKQGFLLNALALICTLGSNTYAANPQASTALNFGTSNDGTATRAHLMKDAAPPADNTGKNVRDRDDQTLTPMDQSNDPQDLRLTRSIRKAIVADDALSTTAKNIKIITIGGKVTLRGPVETLKEKAKIDKKARKLAKSAVDNQLEISSR